MRVCIVRNSLRPLLNRYTIKKGLVAKSGTVIGRGMYFGDDFLLTSYFRPYIVRTLTYLDCFQLDRAVIINLFQFGQFPRLQARTTPTCLCCARSYNSPLAVTFSADAFLLACVVALAAPGERLAC